MITKSVLDRLLHIKFGSGTGSGFLIDHESKQYLVTARHVVEGYSSGNISISYARDWRDCAFELVGHSAKEIDISVLAPKEFIKPVAPIQVSAQGIILGQQVFFLGYPYGLKQEITTPEEPYGSFPFPVLKTGIFSAREVFLLMVTTIQDSVADL